jgi:glycogen synthase
VAKSSRGAKPKRVLMLSWEFPPRIVGGIARVVDELSRALARTGVEVDVLTAYHPGAPSTEVIPVGESRIRVLRAGAQPLHPLDFASEIHQLDFELLTRLLAEDDLRYDVVHAHDWLVAFAARTLRHGRGLPLVATIHATEAGRNRGLHTPLQHYIHSVEWMLTYDAWQVICCTESMATEIQTSLHTPGDKVHIVPNGIDLARMQDTSTPEELAAFRLRWARPDERIVMFVGRLVTEKGVDVLIDAIPGVLLAHPRTKFVVAGGGNLQPLLDHAAARGVTSRIAFTGFLPEGDLPKLYAVSDAAVFPSLYEPFGIVALEAMAAGVPVVTSNAGGFPEVVRHLDTGVQTYAGSPDSLAWGIARVLSDDALAAWLRQAGRREAQENYGWDRIAQQTLDVYALAWEGQAPPSRRPADGPTLHPRYLSGDSGRS